MKIALMVDKKIGADIIKFLIGRGKDEADIVCIITNTNDSMILDAVFEENNIYRTNEMRRIRNILLISQPDLLIVCGYHNLLPAKIYNIPKVGYSINIHLADSDKYRGCYPQTRSIINGDSVYATTFHLIDEGIDTGDISYKRVYCIPDHIKTGEELYNYTMEQGYKHFQEYWILYIRNKLEKLRKQDNIKTVVPCYRKNFPDKEIKISTEDQRRILAFDFEPYDPAFIKIGERIYEIKPKKQVDSSSEAIS